MATKKLAVLGSTGSIGTQALSLVDNLGIKITAISGFSNKTLLEEQALRFRPKTVCAVNKDSADELKKSLFGTGIRVLAGREGLMEIAEEDSCDTLLNSVVGIAGLEPTLAAIESGKAIALANKETLVTGGKLVTDLAKEKNVSIFPVDSEHSAIFQCIQGNENNPIKRIFLTASGGPFFGKRKEQLVDIGVDAALAHPNWSMGKKITIDCSTLMNKGLELIEAMWLFSLSPDDIVITVHRQSVVHSAVEFEDCSVIAQMGLPDMRLPIQYALTYPKRLRSPCAPLSIEAMSNLTFDKPDLDTFRCLAVCIEAAKRGGLVPTAVNAANEVAVDLFLKGKIHFLQINEIVEEALNLSDGLPTDVTLENIIETDRVMRETALKTAAVG